MEWNTEFFLSPYIFYSDCSTLKPLSKVGWKDNFKNCLQPRRWIHCN